MENLKKDIMTFKPFNEQEAKDKEYFLKWMDSYNNLLLRENEFAHFTASALVLNKERTKMLCVYHNIFGGWIFPGGHADGIEYLLNVAVRETEEEAFEGKNFELEQKNIFDTKPIMDEIFSIQSIAIQTHKRKGLIVPAHTHLDVIYLLEADEKRPLKINVSENQGVKWFLLEDSYGKDFVDFAIPINQKNQQKLNLLKAQNMI